MDAGNGKVLLETLLYKVAPIGVITSAILEFLKHYIPEKYTPKVMPILSVVCGGALGYFVNDVSLGLLAGAMAAGGYKFVKDKVFVDRKNNGS